MIPTRPPKRSHYEGRSAVYQAQSATNEPLWRDIVAGAVFFAATLLLVGVLVVGGLLIFG